MKTLGENTKEWRIILGTCAVFRDIIYSGNMGAIAPIRTANSALFKETSGECPSGKIFETEVLWDATYCILDTSIKQMPGFHIELVILKYLINHRCGCGQRSNWHFLMLAGPEAIATRAQPPSKDGNIISPKNYQIQFVWDGYLLQAFWELWSFCD